LSRTKNTAPGDGRNRAEPAGCVGSVRRIELKKEELTDGCTKKKNVQDETSDA
jgi:hypothetical protein